MDQAILVDLDSILDTRIATLSIINQDAAVKAVMSKDYYTRVINDFSKLCGVSLAEFDAAFAKRDVETLKQSLPSAAVFIMNVMIKDLAKQHVESPFADKVKIVINTHPYVLTPEELSSMKVAISMHTGIRVEHLEMVKLPWEVLTPEFIKKNYTGLLFYNFRDWMECQKDNFIKAHIPDILILAPALYCERIPNQEEATLPGAENMTPFDITEGMLIGCFDLHFLGAQHFSLVPPEVLGTPIPPDTFKTKKPA